MKYLCNYTNTLFLPSGLSNYISIKISSKMRNSIYTPLFTPCVKLRMTEIYPVDYVLSKISAKYTHVQF